MREVREGSPSPLSPLPSPLSPGSGERGEGPYTPRLGFTTLLKIEPNV